MQKTQVSPMQTLWWANQSLGGPMSPLVGSVGFLVVSLTPLPPTVLLPQDSPCSASCLAVGLCIRFHQLLDEASLRIIMLGSYIHVLHIFMFCVCFFVFCFFLHYS